MTDYKSSPLPPDASSTAPPPPPKPAPDAAKPWDTTKKKKGHWWIWALLILVIVIGLWIYFRKKAAAEAAAQAKAAQTQRPVPVVTATATKGSIGDYVEALGTVTPVFTVSVTARVQGQITAVHYKEGQMVHKGDPLVDIDPRPYQAALTQSQGQLAHDQAVLAEAKIDLDRYQQAFNQNAIAGQQVDDQAQTVKQDEGTVQNDQGTVAAAQVNVIYTHITSPIDGRVGIRLVDPGNVVQAGSTNPLVVVTQLQPITVIFNVAEDYLPQIQKGMKNGNHLSVDALDRTQESKIASGTVTTLDNQIDVTTGTVKLRATFANTDTALFPNQFVNAKLLLATENGVTLVPNAAVQRNAQGAFVYVIANQTATVHNVTLGTTDGTSTVVQGINPGDVVAINGFDKLQDGIKVTTRGPGQGSGSGGKAKNGGSSSSAAGQPQNNGGSSP
ncbi:MAG: efflux RND transporter periplasmic adaptor subunit [Candidatus Acidiferrales bacterium]